MKRSCALILSLSVAVIVGYFFLIRHYARPDTETAAIVVVAILGGVSLLVFLGSIGTLIQGAKDRSVMRAALAGKPFKDGKRAAAIGHIAPAGLSLCTSPFTGRECVGYEYKVTQTVQTRGGRQSKTSERVHCSGYRLAPVVVKSPQGDIRLLGFPLLDDWKRQPIVDKDQRKRAAEYLATVKFQKVGLGKPGSAFAQFDELFGDEDGSVQKDLGDPVEIQHNHDITEVVVPNGAEACAIGIFSASQNALVYGKKFGVPIRLIPGTAEAALRKMQSSNRMTATFGIVYFLLMHALLGGGYYLSSTSEKRLPESEQAVRLFTAAQDKNLKELDRLLRMGISPDLRDSSGKTLLEATNAPEITRFLLEHGADPDARNFQNNETPLFDAARTGNIERIRLLIKAGAKVNAISRIPWDHSAIDEAAAEQQEQAVQELTQAGAVDPRVTSANGEALPQDGGEPLRICRAFGEAILAQNLQTLRSLTTARSNGYFEGIDFQTWRDAYPVTIQEFSGFMNDSAATITLQGATAGGNESRWVYQMKKISGAWKVHQTWPREPVEAVVNAEQPPSP